MGQSYLFDQSPLAGDSKKRMNFNKFAKLVESFEKPVILPEGSQNVPENETESPVNLAVKPAAGFPQTLFRSGGASGSDAVQMRRADVGCSYRTCLQLNGKSFLLR